MKPDSQPTPHPPAATPLGAAAFWAICGVVPLLKSPSSAAEQVSQLRYGDGFSVYEVADGWAWGQADRDNYAGYAPVAQLAAGVVAPTHRITVPASFVFPEASIKTTPQDRLPLFAAITAGAESGGFVALESGTESAPESGTNGKILGYVHRHHLQPLSAWHAPDWVATALRLLEVPYLWGGTTSLGIDCSGLVQYACEMAGIACPRDSAMQAENLGVAVQDGTLQRGDMVFFKGHVGIMADSHALIHANAFHGRVVVEPLAAVVARGSAVIGVRRVSL